MEKEGIFLSFEGRRDHSLLPCPGTNRVFNSLEVVYADDAGILFQAPSERLLDVIAKIGDTLLEEMTVAGLTLKFGPTKTAAIVRFSGQSAVEAKGLASRGGGQRQIA